MSVTLVRARWMVGASILFALGAMLSYPGGTPLDASTVRYRLTQNFLSDLGMTVAYNGQSNRLGATLFVGSLLLLLIGLGTCLLTIVRLSSAARASRPWARAAGAFGLLACAAFTGVAVTPENRVMAIHVSFTFWAWRIVPIVAALMGIAAVRSGAFRRRVTLVWMLVTAVFSAYAALLECGPSLTSPYGLTVHVIAQKTAAIVAVLAVLYLSRTAFSRQLTAS